MPDDPPPQILLSVVIPVYNYGHSLRRAVDSVLTQLQPGCELLVVDDGSTDETSQVLEEIQARNPPRFSWTRQDNAGAAAARNTGMRCSHGDYLLFLDADDELLPGALDAVCDAIRSGPQVSVILGGRLTRRTDGREKYQPPPSALPPDSCARLADYLLRKRLGMGHGATVVRRDLISRRPYPEKLRGGEDIPVFAFLFAHGEFAMLDRPLVRIYKHHDSLRHARAEADEQKIKTLVEEVFAGLPETCRKLLDAYAARGYLSLSRIALRSGDTAAAGRYWREAAKRDLIQAMRPGQIRKILKAVLIERFRQPN